MHLNHLTTGQLERLQLLGCPVVIRDGEPHASVVGLAVASLNSIIHALRVRSVRRAWASQRSTDRLIEQHALAIGKSEAPHEYYSCTYRYAKFKATRALTRAGFTLVEGAQEWKPPIGPSASPLLDRINLLAFLLREAKESVYFRLESPDIGLSSDEAGSLIGLTERIADALAGKLPASPDTEWTDATSAPTAEDYRELQAQHDQLQSKYKAAMDMLREMLGFVDGTKWQALIDERKAHVWLGRIEALLDGQVLDHPEQPLAMVPEGWEESLNTALVLETERAIKQRDEYLRTGVTTASHGGSHDTCFPAIVRRHIAMLAAAPKPEAKP